MSILSKTVQVAGAVVTSTLAPAVAASELMMAGKVSDYTAEKAVKSLVGDTISDAVSSEE